MSKITAIVILTIIIASVGLSIDNHAQTKKIAKSDTIKKETWSNYVANGFEIDSVTFQVLPADTMFTGLLECCPGYAVVVLKTPYYTTLDTIKLRPWRIRNDSIFEFNHEMTDSIFINKISK